MSTSDPIRFDPASIEEADRSTVSEILEWFHPGCHRCAVVEIERFKTLATAKYGMWIEAIFAMDPTNLDRESVLFLVKSLEQFINGAGPFEEGTAGVQ